MLKHAVFALAVSLGLGGLVPTMARSQTPEPNLPPIPERPNTVESRTEADLLLQQGLELRDRGQYREAIAAWETALAAYTQVYDWNGMARTYTALGSAYAQLDRLRDALQMFESRVFLARQRDDVRGLVAGLNNVGTVRLRRGRVAAAEAAFNEAFALAAENELTRLLGLSTSNLGLVEAATGNVEEALALYENALRLRIEAGDAAGQANTFNNIGDVYWALDDYDNAIANYGAALRLIRDDETAFENYLRAVDGLVEAHNSVGRYLRSQELLETRLNRVRQRNNRREEMKTLQAFAELYLMAGEAREAVRFYQGALAIAQQIEDIRAESRLANTLSRLLDRLQGVES